MILRLSKHHFIDVDSEWREQAACRDDYYDPEWWATPDYSEDDPGQGVLTGDNKYALMICDMCPVKRACAEAAVDEGATGVIRGGIRMSMKGNRRSRDRINRQIDELREQDTA